MDDETWVSVENYEARYKVSSQGRVLSLMPYGRPGRKILKPGMDEAGRPHISLYSGGHRYKTAKVCVLVAQAFLGPKPEGTEICHGDGDPSNNWVTNLRYDTHLANGEDMIRHGRTQKKTIGSCGHPLDGRKKGRNGRIHRYCLICSRARGAVRRKAKRESGAG